MQLFYPANKYLLHWGKRNCVMLLRTMDGAAGVRTTNHICFAMTSKFAAKANIT